MLMKGLRQVGISYGKSSNTIKKEQCDQKTGCSKKESRSKKECSAIKKEKCHSDEIQMQGLRVRVFTTSRRAA
jgi:hypothetical protein